MKIDKRLADTRCKEFRDFLISLGYKQAHESPIFDAKDGPPGSPEVIGETPSHYPLKWNVDPRGALVELWRNSWDYGWGCTTPISQAYISATNPGVVKGWHCHLIQTDRFFCVRGKVMLVTWDVRKAFFEDAEKLEFHVRILDAERNPELVTIPPGVAHGWKALGNEESWVLNLVSHEYDGTDEWRIDPHAHAFDWDQRFDG